MFLLAASLASSAFATPQFAQEAYIKASTPGSGDTFGGSLDLSSPLLVVGAASEDSDLRGVNPPGPSNDAATNSGAAYVFERNGGAWAFDAFIKALNSEQADNFGSSIAASGPSFAVGAPGEDSSSAGVGGDPANNAAQQSGAVYVFRKGPNGWVQEAYIKAAIVDAGDRFGASVALDGDTLVVGAPEEDGGGTGVGADPNSDDSPNAGAVYVFTRSGGNWSQTAYLKASNTDAMDEFGRSVSIAGDLLVVGSEREAGGGSGLGADPTDDSAPGAGAAYVFRRVGGAWTGPTYIKASNTDAGDGFGQSIDLAGTTLVVGALREASGAVGVNGNTLDDNSPAAGAGYIFEFDGSTWTQSTYVKASNTNPADLFGRSVATDGERVLIGAMGEASAATGLDGEQSSNAAPFAGAAYLFRRAGTTWEQEHYVKASNTGSNDWFGYSSSIESDLFVVGAGFEASASPGVNGDQSDDSLLGAGAAYAFVTPVLLGIDYCSATFNSTGLPAALEAWGRPAALENQVSLRARALPPGSFGFFLCSRNRAVVPNVGGGPGVLCLGLDIGRYVGPGQIQMASGVGTFSLQLDLNQTPTPTGIVQVITGDAWNFQAWFRDAGPTGASSNLTNGVSIDFQ